MEQQQELPSKRSRESDETTATTQQQNKKPKSAPPTIPISRGKFKQRWLAKHSSLLKRSDSASGVMVSCNIHAETRALGQIQNMLEGTITPLFPGHEITWERFEGDFEVEENSNNNNNEESSSPPSKAVEGRKDKRFQAVDAACGGLIFYRFRINVKPTDYVTRLMDHLRALPEEEQKQELHKIRHCSRWLPLDYLCPATDDRMTRCFQDRVFMERLEGLEKGTSIAIVTEIRNNQTFKKDTIIKILDPLIPKDKFKVDLKNPDLVIFVTVFKSVCGMSILHDYYARKKYNILSYVEAASKEDNDQKQ
ncbi:hypothetical protein O0I10_000705 [Lichtheimia ornata]|uniref:THUMP domain-containing protein n=1 Tax=Lichtheimia ornata TaxID=688661 RepID=A0AAD8DIE9_9FUNG|nr:uncharacterized protein O0I10_000705 [Lichtheimia ornata]KAJ8663465.1 hypothetical protein O0I10_000705 [Lichtheimia ornata]